MNDATGAKTIELAEAADFALGGVAVRPSTREVVNAGTREVLEPRVMQVLVALAGRRDEVVSRDTLIDMCWGGRAVGEDAIQRCIAKVRKLAETSGAFHIDTVARVGYRLCMDGPAVVLTPVADEPVLVVLPFDNLSDDREMQFFSDGVSEEILQAIAQARGVKVIGRISAFRFRGAQKADAAQALKATHVLDGSVRRSGTRIRISAQLIDTGLGTSIWSGQFDREIGDFLTLQAEVAGAIAEALRLKLDRATPPVAVDPVAYDLWLQARAIREDEFTDQASVAAIALLEQAVARAPNFAKAWASLALSRTMLLPRTHDSIGTPAHAAAEMAARRALAIDPKCGEAIEALAFQYPAFSHYAEKLALFERSVAAEPNDAALAFGYAGTLVSVGRLSESLPFYRRAVEIEPLSARAICVSAIALSTTDLDAARTLVADGLGRLPGSLTMWWTKMLLAGTSAEILAQFETDGPTHPGASLPEMQYIRHIHACFALPLLEERRRAVREIFSPAGSFVRLGIGGYAAAAGCADEAFAAFDAAFQKGQALAAPGSGGIGIQRAVQSSALFYFNAAALRQDPRFAKLCARLGLVDYWTTSSRWPDCADEVPYDFRAACLKAAADLANTIS